MNEISNIPSFATPWYKKPLVWLGVLLVVVVLALLTYFGAGATFLGARLTGPDQPGSFSPVVMHTRSDGLVCYDNGYGAERRSCELHYSANKVRTVALLFISAPPGLETTALWYCRDLAGRGLVQPAPVQDCDDQADRFPLGLAAKSDNFEGSIKIAFCPDTQKIVVGSEQCSSGTRRELGYGMVASAPILTDKVALCDALAENNPALYQKINICAPSPTPTPTPLLSPTPSPLPYSIIFATQHIKNIRSQFAHGAFTGLAGADQVCQDTARSAGLPHPGAFKAILSDSTIDARDRINAVGPIRLANGWALADSEDDLWNSTTPHQYRILTEYGAYPETPNSVLSGTTSTGVKDAAGGDFCNNWTTDSNTENHRLGDVSATDGRWLSSMIQNCSYGGHLYCIHSAGSTPTPAPSIPVP